MRQTNYLHSIKSKWQVIALITAILVLLTVIFSLLQPFKYSSKVGLLVIQKQATTLDPYAASRASERLASSLTSVIRTDSFFNKVLNSGFDITDNWPEKDDKLRKEWQKTVSTSVSPESGILTVTVYHRDSEQAKKISRAIAYVLVNQSAEYHGGGDSVIIKVVDTPLVSNYPVKPAILFNVAAAIVLGIIISSLGIIYVDLKRQGSDHFESNEYTRDESDREVDRESNFKQDIYNELNK